MKFLDLNGLNHLWTKIKESFGTAIVFSSKCRVNGQITIPFVSNHQVVEMDNEEFANVYNWFQKASKGGILEIFFTKIEGCTINCINNNVSYLKKNNLTSQGPQIVTITNLNMQYNNYARLIKIDDNNLFVVEFVENK